MAGSHVEQRHLTHLPSRHVVVEGVESIRLRKQHHDAGRLCTVGSGKVLLTVKSMFSYHLPPVIVPLSRSALGADAMGKMVC